MYNKIPIKYLTRSLICVTGLKIATIILPTSRLDLGKSFITLLLAGMLLAAVNTLVKPVVILFSLPMVMLTLGLFMIVVNGLMVVITADLYSRLDINGFSTAMLVGAIVGLLNFSLTAILERDNKRGK
jgi:putative membrane protein